MLGRALAHYKIQEKLGEGGMGIVYKARDTHLDRPVAIKVLPHDKVSDPERKDRFVQEAKAASALNHPNIITIYDISSDAGTDYMAMEFVKGKALDHLIPKTGLPLADTLKYAIQIADALAAAHHANIVHRDLKPANIMVNERGLVKVLDFGLAKLTESASVSESASTRTDHLKTQAGTIVGSAPYMSPEQAEGKRVDARSDIFSFGAVLYEMLTGRRAFPGDSRLSTLAAVLNQEPKPVSEMVPGLPRDLGKLVVRCLRKDLQRRSQSMAEIKLALEEVKEESELGAVGVTLKRRPWLRFVAAIPVLVVGSAIMSYFTERSRNPPDPFTITPLTTYPGFESNPTFSPDGNQFAFAWDGGDPPKPKQVYVSVVGKGNPLRLTQSPSGSFGPAWSPDGQYLAFLRQDPPSVRYSIYLVPPLGGQERKIGETAGQDRISWFPDSKHLAISDDLDESNHNKALFILSLDGSRRAITRPQRLEYGGDRSPFVSAGGTSILFTRELDVKTSEIAIVDVTPEGLPAGKERILTRHGESNDAAVWTPDGKDILYVHGDSTSDRAVYRVNARGFNARRIDGLGSDAAELIFSRSGRMIFTKQSLDHNLWRMNLQSPSIPPVKFASSTRFEISPAYSPDGLRIAFSSNRGGIRQIWTANAGGESAAPMTSFPDGIAGSPRWSPDGKWIAFDARPGGNADVYVVSSDGGVPQRITDHPAEDTTPCWSPDGRWIYFGSTRNGPSQIFRTSSTGGEPVQITRNGGSVPMASLDGERIYYTIPRKGIWTVPAIGGDETLVASDVLMPNSYTITPRGIYFIGSRESGSEWPIRLLNPVDNSSKTIGKITKPPGLYISVSPDGKWLAWSQTDEDTADLMLVENFR